MCRIGSEGVYMHLFLGGEELNYMFYNKVFEYSKVSNNNNYNNDDNDNNDVQLLIETVPPQNYYRNNNKIIKFRVNSYWTNLKEETVYGAYVTQEELSKKSVYKRKVSHTQKMETMYETTFDMNKQKTVLSTDTFNKLKLPTECVTKRGNILKAIQSNLYPLLGAVDFIRCLESLKGYHIYYDFHYHYHGDHVMVLSETMVSVRMNELIYQYRKDAHTYAVHDLEGFISIPGFYSEGGKIFYTPKIGKAEEDVTSDLAWRVHVTEEELSKVSQKNIKTIFGSNLLKGHPFGEKDFLHYYYPRRIISRNNSDGMMSPFKIIISNMDS
eukprot:GHVR01176429.1.p1 GENE.GHVR01176429.1~~GHVR01176429.1.p1  ORF type:complete len:326 (-),score=43.30 GHVR01176429.1:242-1219(-)